MENIYSYTNLTDSHFHILEMIEKELAIDVLLTEWFLNGGQELIDIGVDEINFDTRIEYSTKYPLIYHTAGIHPNSITDNLERIVTLEKQLTNKKIVGLGEIGLDYYWDTVPKKLQQEFFGLQLQLAKKHKLPVIIHNREASSDIHNILKENKSESGIIHCFSSNKEFLKKFLDLGFYISFAGNITYKKNIEIQECLTYVPLDKLLLETDSPYLSPIPLRGRLNSPNNIIYTFNFVSDYLSIEKSKLKKQMQNNLLNIFNLREE
ncbi:MAG: TatD family hydrolase [Spirochaetales bacterium]|nr:TatD family hydrolase [Spirochaetales bacterium]